MHTSLSPRPREIDRLLSLPDVVSTLKQAVKDAVWEAENQRHPSLPANAPGTYRHYNLCKYLGDRLLAHGFIRDESERLQVRFWGPEQQDGSRVRLLCGTGTVHGMAAKVGRKGPRTYELIDQNKRASGQEKLHFDDEPPAPIDPATVFHNAWLIYKRFDDNHVVLYLVLPKDLVGKNTKFVCAEVEYLGRTDLSLVQVSGPLPDSVITAPIILEDIDIDAHNDSDTDIAPDEASGTSG